MRAARNIIVWFMSIAIFLGFSLYMSSAIYVVLAWGIKYLDFSVINPSFSSFPDRLWPTIFDFLSHWSANRVQYSMQMTLKLFFSLLAPFWVFGVILWSIRRSVMDWRPFKKKESLHGDARWASDKDIKRAGLRSKKGLLLGEDKSGKFYIAGGCQHALLFAPTGSGKGVGFVIPNLLMWGDSVVVHDIKLENYGLTSGWRQNHLKQNVYCWNPANPDGMSHCYNPLDWVSSKPGQMVDDVQKIANLLMPEQDFWVNEARSLFLGVALYLLAVPGKVKSFGEVVRTMRTDDVVYNLAVVLDTMGKDIHPVAYMNIAAFLQKAEKERSGVISHMNSSLELWANPLIDAATATSDFNFMDFKRSLHTVYVGVTPDNLMRLRPLLQVFYQQATDFLCRYLPRADEPYSVLFLMDEFPSLGKMEQFQTGIAYFRGYNVRLFLIVQDTEQLKGTYEEAGMNSFLSNSTYRITFAANNIETANLISQLIGNKTVEQESLNRPKFMDVNPSSRSLHVSDTQRALLLPQEVILLPRDEQILLLEATPPIKSKKIVYYKHKLFSKRVKDPVFVPIQEPFDPVAFSKMKEEVKQTRENRNNAADEMDEAKDQAMLAHEESSSADFEESIMDDEDHQSYATVGMKSSDDDECSDFDDDEIDIDDDDYEIDIDDDDEIDIDDDDEIEESDLTIDTESNEADIDDDEIDIDDDDEIEESDLTIDTESNEADIDDDEIDIDDDDEIEESDLTIDTESNEADIDDDEIDIDDDDEIEESDLTIDTESNEADIDDDEIDIDDDDEIEESDLTIDTESNEADIDDDEIDIDDDDEIEESDLTIDTESNEADIDDDEIDIDDDDEIEESDLTIDTESNEADIDDDEIDIDDDDEIEESDLTIDTESNEADIDDDEIDIDDDDEIEESDLTIDTESNEADIDDDEIDIDDDDEIEESDLTIDTESNEADIDDDEIDIDDDDEIEESDLTIDTESNEADIDTDHSEEPDLTIDIEEDEEENNADPEGSDEKSDDTDHSEESDLTIDIEEDEEENNADPEGSDEKSDDTDHSEESDLTIDIEEDEEENNADPEGSDEKSDDTDHSEESDLTIDIEEDEEENNADPEGSDEKSDDTDHSEESDLTIDTEEDDGSDDLYISIDIDPEEEKK